MIDQRAQDGGGSSAAERADECPVVFAGLSLPTTVARAHARGLVEQVPGCPFKHLKSRPGLTTSASFHAGRLVPEAAATLAAPAPSRYPRHIPGWCDPRRTRPSPPR